MASASPPGFTGTSGVTPICTCHYRDCPPEADLPASLPTFMYACLIIIMMGRLPNCFLAEKVSQNDILDTMTKVEVERREACVKCPIV